MRRLASGPSICSICTSIKTTSKVSRSTTPPASARWMRGQAVAQLQDAQGGLLVGGVPRQQDTRSVPCSHPGRYFERTRRHCLVAVARPTKVSKSCNCVQGLPSSSTGGRRWSALPRSELEETTRRPASSSCAWSARRHSMFARVHATMAEFDHVDGVHPRSASVGDSVRVIIPHLAACSASTRRIRLVVVDDQTAPPSQLLCDPL